MQAEQIKVLHYCHEFVKSRFIHRITMLRKWTTSMKKNRRGYGGGNE
jgi:hypothetical protein